LACDCDARCQLRPASCNLVAGWALNQASGSQAGVVLLLKKGAVKVLCFLVPAGLTGRATAHCGCRRLN